jgi:hypothetical protein
LAEHPDIARLRRQVDAPCGVEPRHAIECDPPRRWPVEASQRSQVPSPRVSGTHTP